MDKCFRKWTFDPHGAWVGISQENQDNAITDDKLVLDITRLSATMVLVIWGKRELAFHKEEFQLPAPYIVGRIVNANIWFYVSSNKTSMQMQSVSSAATPPTIKANELGSVQTMKISALRTPLRFADLTRHQAATSTIIGHMTAHRTPLGPPKPERYRGTLGHWTLPSVFGCVL